MGFLTFFKNKTYVFNFWVHKIVFGKMFGQIFGTFFCKIFGKMFETIFGLKIISKT